MPAEAERIAGPALKDRWTSTSARVSEAESALFDGVSSSLEADVARLETRVYLGSQLLRDLDVMSMAHGLEVRVPFVDHVLLDAVWPDLGAHPSLMRNKRLLHETLARPLPRAAVDRPKQTFTLPFASWMTGALQPFVRSGMAALAGGRLDREGRARRDLGGVAPRRRTLEPPVVARGARRISPSTMTVQDNSVTLGSFEHRRDYGAVTGRDRWTVQAVNAWVRETLPTYVAALADGAALDVGCGEQPFRTLIESYGRRYVGMDVVQNSSRTVDILSTLEDAPSPAARFPLILCTEVLEHVGDIDAAFAGLRRLAAPGGAVVVTVPFVFPCTCNRSIIDG